MRCFNILFSNNEENQVLARSVHCLVSDSLSPLLNQTSWDFETQMWFLSWHCQPVPNRYPNLPCILTFSLYPNRSNDFFSLIFNHFQWFVKSISSFGTHMIVAQGARPKACWEGSLQQDAYHQKLGEAPLPVEICQLRRDQYYCLLPGCADRIWRSGFQIVYSLQAEPP